MQIWLPKNYQDNLSKCKQEWAILDLISGNSNSAVSEPTFLNQNSVTAFSLPFYPGSSLSFILFPLSFAVQKKEMKRKQNCQRVDATFSLYKIWEEHY